MQLKFYTYIFIFIISFTNPLTSGNDIMIMKIINGITKLIRETEYKINHKEDEDIYPNKFKVVSGEFLVFLLALEGKRNKPYKDVAGLWTIGIGHLIKREELFTGKININGVPVEYKNGLTDDQVFDLLKQDLVQYEDSVRTNVKIPLKQHQYEALVSFTFNVGRSAFERSTMLKQLNYGEVDLIPAQFMRWVYAGGKKWKGLVNRRNKELELFLYGKYN